MDGRYSCRHIPRRCWLHAALPLVALAAGAPVAGVPLSIVGQRLALVLGAQPVPRLHTRRRAITASHCYAGRWPLLGIAGARSRTALSATACRPVAAGCACARTAPALQPPHAPATLAAAATGSSPWSIHKCSPCSTARRGRDGGQVGGLVPASRAPSAPPGLHTRSIRVAEQICSSTPAFEPNTRAMGGLTRSVAHECPLRRCHMLRTRAVPSPAAQHKVQALLAHDSRKHPHPQCSTKSRLCWHTTAVSTPTRSAAQSPGSVGT